MFQIKNFTDNDDVRTLDSKGPFTVIEYQRDLSVTPGSAQTAYFCNEMNIRKRQVICTLGASNITLQAGAMQWMPCRSSFLNMNRLPVFRILAFEAVKWRTGGSG